MMTWFKQILSYLLGQFAYQFFIKQVKKKAILTYLKTLKIIRQSLLATILLLVTLQLMSLGLVGLLVTGVWLFPVEDLHTKLWILFTLFSIIFLIPCLGLFLFFSEKTWLRLSGAEKLLSKNN